MILADKITELRKKRGWSQEQLAEQLDVSRQSVSKWESAMSVPDMDKIIKMSNIFGVSTDYLLKDEMESITPAENIDHDENGVFVSFETANTYLELVYQTAGKTALAVMILVLCPIPLILLGGLSTSVSGFFLTENMAGGLGIAILLLMVAAAVTVLILNNMKLEKYEFLENEQISLEYGVKGMAEKKMGDYRRTHRKLIAVGAALCISAVVPLMLALAFGGSDFAMVLGVCAILSIVSVGVYCFVLTCSINGSYQKLLQEGDYTVEKKIRDKKLKYVSPIYWCTVTAIYLFISFSNNSWGKSWIIWPVARLIYVVISLFAEYIVSEK